MSKTPQNVEAYIALRSAGVAAILSKLRALIHATLPDVTEKMKYGAPVYWNKAGEEVVYLYGGKDHANLGFQNGVVLADPDHLLKGSGKTGRHVEIYSENEPPDGALTALLRQVA